MRTSLPSRIRSDRRGRRSALQALAVLVPTFGGLGSSTAQQNAPAVAPAVTPALRIYCGPFGNVGRPTVCNLLGAPDATLSQLAPDKFVTQTTTVLRSTDQQFSSARIRLCELRDARLGDGSCGRVAGRARRAMTPTPPESTRIAADAAPGAWAFRTASLDATPRRQAQAVAARDGGGSYMLAQATATDATTDTKTAQDGDTGAIAANPLGLYIRGNGRNDTSDPTDFDPGFKVRTANMTVGADYLLGPAGVVGAALDYANSRSALRTGDGTPDSHVTTRGLGVSVYGAYFPAPSAYIDATLVYNRDRYSSSRNIPALTDTALGDTKGSRYGMDVGTGYSFQSARFSYGPYGRVTFSRTRVAAFREQGNPSNSNLAVEKQRVSSLTSTLGAQVGYSVSQSWGVLVPNARLEWEHQYRDDRVRSILASFAGAVAASPTVIPVSTTPVDRNYFNLGLGLAAHFGVGRSALIYYQTVLGRSGQTSHAVTAELRLEL